MLVSLGQKLVTFYSFGSAPLSLRGSSHLDRGSPTEMWRCECISLIEAWQMAAWHLKSTMATRELRICTRLRICQCVCINKQEAILCKDPSSRTIMVNNVSVKIDGGKRDQPGAGRIYETLALGCGFNMQNINIDFCDLFHILSSHSTQNYTNLYLTWSIVQIFLPTSFFWTFAHVFLFCFVYVNNQFQPNQINKGNALLVCSPVCPQPTDLALLTANVRVNKNICKLTKSCWQLFGEGHCLTWHSTLFPVQIFNTAGHTDARSDLVLACASTNDDVYVVE